MNETYSFTEAPWFKHNPQHKPRSVAIIGAGLAGCQTAFTLAQSGIQVTLIERNQGIAQLASGNLSGVIYPKFSAHNTAQSRFYAQAFLHATQHIPTILGTSNSDGWSRCGVLSLSHTAKQTALHSALIDAVKNGTHYWPDDTFHALNPEQASARAGIRQSFGGLFFPTAGCVNPKILCATLIHHSDVKHNIKVLTQHNALSLCQDGEQWVVENTQGSVRTDAVVIANALDAREFEQTRSLKVKNIRGQISYVHSLGTAPLQTVICHDGYITPPIRGIYNVGASFNLKDNETHMRHSDHITNIDKVRTYVPDMFTDFNIHSRTVNQGRVCFRCQSVDYLPIIGPVGNQERCHALYSKAFRGNRHAPLHSGAHYRGLYINIAHGSRGISHTGLGARIIADYIHGTPHHVDEEILHAVHPARFIIRDMKRNLF